MWTIYEHRRVEKQLLSAHQDVRKKYEKWKDIVTLSGPQGLRALKGLHDESLRGEWKGYRSSRLNLQYRVIYKVESEQILIQVVKLTPHDLGGSKMKNYRKAKKHIEVSVGESVRILREFQELSQNELANLTGIPQSTISAIENDRVQLGVERAKVFARALQCHPAVLVFPGWDIQHESAA